jgi:PAS domain S-box-containing protein
MRFFGKSEDEVRRNGWQSLVHPDDGNAYSEAFFTALRQCAPFHAQARVMRHDGKWRWVESWGAPKLAASGALLGYVGSSPDITERKQMEEALREADRRKDQALAIVAHELRNPLAPIVNALQLLGRAPHDSVEARKARDTIERQVSHMSRLIGDLLDLSGIHAGKIELRRGACDLVAVVRHAVDNERLAFAERGLNLHFDTPQPRLWVFGDEIRLTQITANLLNNAIKFTDRGGHVYVDVGAVASSGSAFLRVRDTGIGIEAGVLQRIFEPFEQAQPGLGRGGLGMGLALVKALAELHGGGAVAESEGPGRGSVFAVTLPLASGDTVARSSRR